MKSGAISNLSAPHLPFSPPNLSDEGRYERIRKSEACLVRMKRSDSSATLWYNIMSVILHLTGSEGVGTSIPSCYEHAKAEGKGKIVERACKASFSSLGDFLSYLIS